jgi:hypothetical protein
MPAATSDAGELLLGLVEPTVDLLGEVVTDDGAEHGSSIMRPKKAFRPFVRRGGVVRVRRMPGRGRATTTPSTSWSIRMTPGDAPPARA